MFTVSALNSSLQLFMVCTCIWLSSVECMGGCVTLVLKQQLNFLLVLGVRKGVGCLSYAHSFWGMLSSLALRPSKTPRRSPRLIRVRYQPPCHFVFLYVSILNGPPESDPRKENPHPFNPTKDLKPFISFCDNAIQTALCLVNS